MRLAVITPIGPRHAALAAECALSVERAWLHCQGPFSKMRHHLIDDTQEPRGRSWARNEGIRQAEKADWCFFIDADDVCELDAFLLVDDALGNDPALVAIFGAVCIDKWRVIPENVWPCDWDDVMQFGAQGTLSMGCFARAAKARAVQFNEDMDYGEDFDFYLRLLHDRPWTKLREPLVTIGRRHPSAGGPRGYDKLDWRAECQRVVDAWKKDAA